MLQKFTEVKLWKYLQDILDALGGGGGGGGTGDASAAKQDEQTALLQTISDNTTNLTGGASTNQATTTYYTALTNSAQWVIGHTIGRVQVFDLVNPETPVLVSTDWTNETLKTSLTLVPVIDTDVKQIGSPVTVPLTGVATERTLYRTFLTLSDTQIDTYLTGTDLLGLDAFNKATIFCSFRGSGTFNTAPVVSVYTANGIWEALTNLDPSFRALTTASNQDFKINCAGFQMVRISYSISGSLAFRAVQATAPDVSSLAKQDNQYMTETVCQTVDFTTGSATSSATFDPLTKRILLTPTEDCWVKLGGTATAGGTSFFICAGIPFPPIFLNGTTSLSVIGKTANGQLSIFESL